MNRGNALARSVFVAVIVACVAGIAAAQEAPMAKAAERYPEGTLLILVVPEYPAEALARGETNTVEVKGRVGADGSLAGVTLLSDPPNRAFEESITGAVTHWRLMPWLGKDCRWEEREARVTIWFEIAEGKPKISYSRPKLMTRSPDEARVAKTDESRYRIIQHVSPRYPSGVWRAAPERVDQLAYICVGTDGKPSGVAVAPMRYYKSFEEEIVYSLKKWRFEVQPGPFIAEVPIRFLRAQ
jgi:TonB family protein